MNANISVVADLLARGFVFDASVNRMEFAYGSICHYTKCTVYMDRVYGDLREEYMYRVRYESFAESGQPEVDHHIITDSHVAESQLSEFMRNNGIQTDSEIEAERIIRKQRMYERRLRRQQS
jgi:hypothetical protein